MAIIYHRLKLSTGTRCRAAETPKAYALQWRNTLYFVPKSLCKLYELDVDTSVTLHRWIIEIPIWLYKKNEDIKEIVDLIREQNENKY